jgi:hypothetical protein
MRVYRGRGWAEARPLQTVATRVAVRVDLAGATADATRGARIDVLGRVYTGVGRSDRASFVRRLADVGPARDDALLAIARRARRAGRGVVLTTELLDAAVRAADRPEWTRSRGAGQQALAAGPGGNSEIASTVATTVGVRHASRRAELTRSAVLR